MSDDTRVGQLIRSILGRELKRHIRSGSLKPEHIGPGVGEEGYVLQLEDGRGVWVDPGSTVSPNASTTVKGITKLSVTPASASSPIAVGDNDSRMTNAREPSGPAGGVLGGTYPDPSFAVDMATQAELSALTAISTVNTNTTITNNDRIVLVTGSVTITLPAAPSSGQYHVIKDVAGTAGTGAITIGGNGNTIDGQASIQLTVNYESITAIYGGAAWSVI